VRTLAWEDLGEPWPLPGERAVPLSAVTGELAGYFGAPVRWDGRALARAGVGPQTRVGPAAPLGCVHVGSVEDHVALLRAYPTSEGSADDAVRPLDLRLVIDGSGHRWITTADGERRHTTTWRHPIGRVVDGKYARHIEPGHLTRDEARQLVCTEVVGLLGADAPLGDLDWACVEVDGDALVATATAERQRAIAWRLADLREDVAGSWPDGPGRLLWDGAP